VTTPEEKILEENKLAIEEQRIQFEAIQKEYDKLKKDDPKFIGIALESKEYWIYGNGWNIKQLGFTNKKAVSEYFGRHDDLVVKHGELDPVKDGIERIRIMNDMVKMRDEIVEVCIPMMLTEKNGKPFDSKKWFGDNKVPAAAWWDCVRDCFLFLRESGSKDDTLLSMMPRSSE
jgi:hypothetical protein